MYCSLIDGEEKSTANEVKTKQKTKKHSVDMITYEEERLKQEENRLKLNEELHKLQVIQIQRETELLELEIENES